MKMEIKVEGCPFEDQDTLKTFSYAMDFASTLSEVKSEVRNRLKWGENLTDDEVRFLENLQDLMFIEGPQW